LNVFDPVVANDEVDNNFVLLLFPPTQICPSANEAENPPVINKPVVSICADNTRVVLPIGVLNNLYAVPKLEVVKFSSAITSIDVGAVDKLDDIVNPYSGPVHPIALILVSVSLDCTGNGLAAVPLAFRPTYAANAVVPNASDVILELTPSLLVKCSNPPALVTGWYEPLVLPIILSAPTSPAGIFGTFIWTLAVSEISNGMNEPVFNWKPAAWIVTLPSAFDIDAPLPPGISDAMLIDADCRYISLNGFSKVPIVAPLASFGNKSPPNSVEPLIAIEPLNSVLPIKVLLPIWVVEPDTKNEPVIVWLPINEFEPVVA